MTLSDYREHLKDLTPEIKAVVGEIIDEAVLIGQEFETLRNCRRALVEMLDFARELKGETKL